MSTSTTNFGLTKPAVNDPTDADLWGTELNTDLDSLDGLLLTTLNWITTAASGTITVTARTAASTTTGSSKKLYVCDASGGAFAANLPAAATATNLVVGFVKKDSSANAVTITANGAETINASTTFSLSGQYAFVLLVCDGTLWRIISQTAAAVSVFTGDSGSGGTAGTVPAPSAGDAALNKVLGAGGSWVARSPMVANMSFNGQTAGSGGVDFSNNLSKSRASTGVYNFTFGTAQADTHYTVNALCARTGVDRMAIEPSSKTTAGFTLSVFDSFTNAATDAGSPFEVSVFRYV